MTSLTILFTFLFTIVAPSWGMNDAKGDESLEKLTNLSCKKMTLSENDHHTYWALCNELRENFQHIQFVDIEEYDSFESFYEKSKHAQENPSADPRQILDLNPISGIYLFYEKDNEKPIGFVRIEDSIENGLVEPVIVFTDKSPKGAGGMALSHLKDSLEKYIRQPMLFRVRQEDGTFLIEPHIIHIATRVETSNIASLIFHVRVGMEPAFVINEEIEGEKKMGVGFIYPSLQESENPLLYKVLMEHKVAVEKIKPILKNLEPKETRKQALQELICFFKDLNLNK